MAVDTVTGCIFSDSSSIVASPIFTTTSSNGVINCTTSGVPINVSASPAGIYSYSWSPSSSLSNANTSNPTASPSVTTTYTVVVTSALGCSVSDTVIVNVNIPSLYSFNVIPLIDTICSGSSLQLNTIIQKGCGANGSVCGGPVSASQAGTAVTFSNATGITPFAGSVVSEKMQCLYRASELIAAGMNQATTITQIGLNIQSIVGSNSYQNFTIKMGCTSTNTMTTTYISALPTVYNPKPTAIFNGMNYFVLDNTYDWDGVSNLAIEICFSNSITSQNSFIYYSAPGFTATIYSSGASVCANASGTTGTNRPNTYFKHCGASGGTGFDYAWTPSSSLNYDTVANPIASPTANTTYTVIVTDTSSGCIMTDTSSVVVLGLNSAVVNLGNDATLCTGNNITLNAGTGFSSYQWSTGATTSTITVSASGTYWAIGTNMCGMDRDTITISYYPVNSLSLGTNQTLCSGNTITLNATATGFTNYVWSTGATTSSIVVGQGTYWVSSNNVCGSASDTVVVSAVNAPSAFSLGNDTILCIGNNVTLNTGGSGQYSYQWSTGATGSSIIAGTSGTYWVNVTNQCGTANDSINISYYPANSLSLGPDMTICSGNTTTITTSATGFTNFVWSTGASTTSIVVSSAGTYWVSSNNICGSASDTINVAVVALPVTTLGNDTTLCVGNNLTLTATGGFTSYIWNTGSTNQSIAISSGGTYWVNVSNSCGSNADTININYYPANSLSLGNDTAICQGDSVLLALTSSGFTNFIWSTGATTTSINVNTSGTYWVSSNNICGTAADSINVSIGSDPTVSLGNDTAICTQTILAATATNAGSYSWSTGSTSSSITITQPGTYWVQVTNQCSSDSDTIVIMQGIAPVFSLGNDSTLCSTQTINIDITGTGTGYVWQDNSTLPTYTITSSGIYWVIVTNAAGCTSTDSMTAIFDFPPFIFAPNDTVICDGEEIILAPLSSGSYVWNNGTSNSPITVGSDGLYIVYTANICGSASDSVRVTTEKCSCLLDVPNAFSPNDDGINDVFYVRGYCDIFLLRIYDRWGEKVFETSDITQGWNGIYKGKKMNSGIFNFYFVVRPDSEDKQVKKGNLSLIR